jgi:hypothetical protein
VSTAAWAGEPCVKADLSGAAHRYPAAILGLIDCWRDNFAAVVFKDRGTLVLRSIWSAIMLLKTPRPPRRRSCPA